MTTYIRTFMSLKVLHVHGKHFLQECPLYLNERNTMLNELQGMVIMPNIPYGSSKYTADLNFSGLFGKAVAVSRY